MAQIDRLYLLSFILWWVVAFSIELDSSVNNRNIKNIAFGSCNKYKRGFEYFQNIINAAPDIWLWTGDIVYGKTDHGTNLTNIRNNYRKLKSHPLYQQFMASNTIIEGVYDDHDMGMNDADIRFPKALQKEAQTLLLDFLNIGQSNPRRHRKGVYSAHKYNDILLILLDTRTHRSPTAVLPSISKYEYPLFNLLAAYMRYLIAYFGFTHDYNGTILGAEQWHWFENILRSKEYELSELVLIVSSTQIFTKNPYFESWTHFPLEKLRLIKTVNQSIEDNDDKHILFISGDVHHSELLYGNADYGPLEVSSSGLTHSLLSKTILFGLEPLIRTQIAHSYKACQRTKYTQNVYYGRNFGMIHIDGRKYNLSIYDSVSGERVISVALNSEHKSSFKHVMREFEMGNNINFEVVYPFYGLELLCPLMLCIGICVCVVKIICAYFLCSKMKQD